MLRSTLLKTFCILAAVILITGCGATGPRYESAAQAPADKGLVYIYRPGKLMGNGVVFDVHVGPQADDKAIVGLRSGGYLPYYVEPGEVEFWAKTESTSSVTIDVKPGQTTYLRGSIGVGVFVGRPSLKVVDASTGEKEIKECKLLQASTAN